MPKGHIMTATPTYNSAVHCDYSGSLAIAAAHCILRDVWLDPRFAPGFSLVEYARNWLVAEFLQSKCTHLFWIDDDLFFPPDKIYRLFSRSLDVVCGVYTTKHDTAPTYPYSALGPEVDGLQEAERVPGGFMCMSRKAVEAVAEQCIWHEIEHNNEKRKAPRFFDLHLDGDKLVGEDYIACARLRKAGFKIWVETDIPFKHYGRRAWCGNLHDALAEEAKKGVLGQNTPEAWEKNRLMAEHTLSYIEDK